MRDESAFRPNLLVAAFGALWCTDGPRPVLARVDSTTRKASLAAAFPRDAGDGRGANTDWHGANALVAGLGAIWLVPAGGDRLIRVDPADGSMTSRALPFAVHDLAAGTDAVFAVSHRHGIVRCSEDGEITTASVGTTLRLIAATKRFVWTIDDAPATIIALDAQSLEVVRTFHYIGAPVALFAHGTQAWYLARREEMLPPKDGRQQRTGIVTTGNTTVEMLRCDAASGELLHLGQWPATRNSAADDAGFWIAGPPREKGGPEPVTELRRMTRDGETIVTVARPGQVHAIASGDSAVWVAGFRRARQATVLTALTPDGAEIGEADFSQIDLAPWAPPPRPPRPVLAPADRARAVQAAVAAGLSTPRQVLGRFGDRWEEPAVCATFHLERVDLEGTDQAPLVVVLFRWKGEAGLFGSRYPIPEGDWAKNATDAYICVRVEEDLLAAGFGIENATRETADGVTWLQWPSLAGPRRPARRGARPRPSRYERGAS